MVLYIFMVAVLNLGLGFVLAVYAARRYRLLTSMGAELFNGNAMGMPRRSVMPQAGPPAVTLAPAAEVLPQDRGTNSSNQAAAAAPAAQPVAAGSRQSSPAAPLPAAEDRPPSAGEQSVASFQAEVAGYRDQVTQANEALRSYMGTADPSEIEACLQSLMAATNEYLDRRQQVQQGFEELHGQQPQLAGVRAEVQSAVQQQDVDIKRTADAIEDFDYQVLVEDSQRAVLGQTDQLLDSSDRLRDTLDEAMVEVQRSENRLATPPAGVRLDRLTGLLSRAGLEVKLARWWQSDPQRTRPLSVATIDLDQFAEINQRFGRKLGDTLLHAVGKLLEAESRGEAATATARFSGQRFALLFPDTDVRSATNAVERIRQMIEITVLEHRQGEIRLTVSCGVTAAAAEDTSESLFARAEATLREAKRYGRNRTFLHEGKFPTPVVPPNFALESRRITL